MGAHATCLFALEYGASSDVIPEQLHLAVHAEDTVHGQVLVIVANWSVFLGRSIVELIWLHSDKPRFLQLHLQKRLVVNGFVHLVLLTIAMHGSRTLGHFPVLVR